MEPGESDSGEDAEKGPRKRAPKPPTVTLDQFLKPPTAAAAASKKQQQQQQQHMPQRVEVDVDSFFAAAASKELQKHRKGTAAAYAHPPAPAAAAAGKEEKGTAKETAAEQDGIKSERMSVDEEPKTLKAQGTLGV